MNNQPYSPTDSIKPIEGQPYIFYGYRYTFYQLIINRLKDIEDANYDMVYLSLMRKNY